MVVGVVGVVVVVVVVSVVVAVVVVVLVVFCHLLGTHKAAPQGGRSEREVKKLTQQQTQLISSKREHQDNRVCSRSVSTRQTEDRATQDPRLHTPHTGGITTTTTHLYKFQCGKGPGKDSTTES